MTKTILAAGLALLFIAAIALPQAGQAAGPTSPTDTALGEQQVEKLWSDFAQADLAALDRYVAPGFQSLHEDGARDWSQERLLVAGLKLSPYVLSDYKVTREGDVLVVTYLCRVGETIAAARLAKAPTPRLDVFQQTAGEWKLLSHVNVRKVTATSTADPSMMAVAEE
jgi:hypothetical protein